MTTVSVSEFVELIRKNNLFDKKQLKQLERWAAQCNDVQRIAGALVRHGWLTRWQAGQLMMGRSVHLGKYRLLNVLRRGEQESIFLAEHTAMNRQVALKILSKHLCSDQKRLQQFVAEAQSMAGLEHPNLVRVLDVDQEAGRYFQVLEYVEGHDLDQIAETEGPLPIAQVVDIILQAASGLQFAHEHGLIHGALQPANVLVTETGVVKIVGIGSSKIIYERSTSSGESGLPFNPEFTAPELLAGEQEPDALCDIYSLGCCFYFALTAKPPFSADSVEEHLTLRGEPPPDPRTLRPETPPELAELCRQLMHPDRNQRPQGLATVVEQLRNWEPPRSLKRAAPLEQTIAAEEDEPVEPELEDVPTDKAETEAEGETETDHEKPQPAQATKASTAGGAVRRLLLEVFDLLRQRFLALPMRLRLAVVAGGVVVLLVPIVAAIWLLTANTKHEEQLAASPTGASVQTEPAQSQANDSGVSQPAEPSFPQIPLSDAPIDPKLLQQDVKINPQQFQVDVKPVAKDRQEPQQRSGSQPPESHSEQSKPPARDTAAENKEQAKPKPPQKPPQASGKEQSSSQESKQQSAEKPSTEQSAENTNSDKSSKNPGSEGGKQTAEKPQDPFAGVPAIRELPVFDPKSGQPNQVSLARINTDPNTTWQLILLGGPTAYRKNRSFELEQTEFDTANAAWSVYLTSTTGREERVKVAELRRKSNQLLFAWAANAPDPEANYLRNCILQIRVEGRSHYLTLRKPVGGDPIVIDLRRGVASATIEAKWVPQGDFVRLEIPSIVPEAQLAVTPGPPTTLAEPTAIAILYKDRHNNTVPAMKIQADFDVRVTGVSVRARFEQPAVAELKRLLTAIGPLRAKLEPLKMNIEKQLSPKGREPPRGAQRTALEKQLEQVDFQLWLLSYLQESQNQLVIHYRLVVPVDDHEIVLATSRQSGTAAQR